MVTNKVVRIPKDVSDLIAGVKGELEKNLADTDEIAEKVAKALSCERNRLCCDVPDAAGIEAVQKCIRSVDDDLVHRLFVLGTGLFHCGRWSVKSEMTRYAILKAVCLLLSPPRVYHFGVEATDSVTCIVPLDRRDVLKQIQDILACPSALL